MKKLLKYFGISMGLLVSTAVFGQTFKYIGTSGSDEGGNVVIEHPTNSNLLIGGTEDGKAAIYEVTTAGVVVNNWSFDIKSSVKDYINRMSIDSDGHLIGCGISGPGQYDGFAFRFDLSTSSLLWQHETTAGTGEHMRYVECIDLPSSNEILIVMTIRDQNSSTENKSEAAIIKLNRTTGAAITSTLRQYTNNQVNNQDDGFYSSRMLNGHLYISGRGKMKTGSGNSRPIIAEIDITGTYGNVVNSDLFVRSISSSAELRARDYTFRNSNTQMLAGIDGSYSSGSNSSNQFILLEKTVGSTANTFRRYQVSGSSGLYVESVKDITGGALVYLRDRNNFDLYLVKYSISGSTYTIDWSKRYNNFPGLTVSLPGRRDGMLIQSSSVFFVGEALNGSNYDIVFAEVDLATGNISGSDACVFDATVTLVETSNYTASYGYNPLTHPYSSTLNTPSLTSPTMPDANVCGSAPVDSCDYTVDPQVTPNSDCEYTFSALVTGTTGSVVSYLWDFGDGNTSTAANPTHQYFTAGSYIVTVTVYSFYFDGTSYVCCEQTAQVGPIEVAEPCDPCEKPTGFSAREECCGVYSFQSSGVYGNTQVFWKFGDGTTGTGAQALHSYAANGTYTVQMFTMYYAEDVCCVQKSSQTVVVNCPDLPAVKSGKNWNAGAMLHDDESLETQPTSVDERATEFGSLALFPNPANQQLRIVSEKGNIEQISFVDNLGRQSLSVPAKGAANAQIDISSLESGMYHVIVTTSNGVEYGQIVKE